MLSLVSTWMGSSSMEWLSTAYQSEGSYDVRLFNPCGPGVVPAKEADPQLAMGPSGRGFGDFPSCEVGMASLIPGRTNWEKAWDTLHGISDQPSYPRAELAAWQPMVCREPGLLAGSEKGDFFERLGPVNAVPFHGHSHRGQQPLNIHTVHIQANLFQAIPNWVSF